MDNITENLALHSNKLYEDPQTGYVALAKEWEKYYIQTSYEERWLWHHDDLIEYGNMVEV